MKKKFLVAFFMVLVGLVTASFFVKNVFTKRSYITADLAQLTEVMTDNNKLALWFAPFSEFDTSKIDLSKRGTLIEKGNTNSIRFKKKTNTSYVFENDKKQLTAFTTDPESTNKFNVTVQYETTYWDQFFGNSAYKKNALASLQNLHQLFTGTKKRYGYDITKTTVEDTTVIFKSAIVAKKDVVNATNQLFAELLQLAAKTNAQYNGKRLLHFIAIDSSETKIFASIGVRNSGVENTTPAPFLFKRMPYGKNLLEIKMIGNLSEIDNAVKKLERYRVDEHLSTMAIPYMRIDDASVMIADSTKMKVSVFYPVY